MNMTLLLTVLPSCWRYFDAVFPSTSARLHHWLYFLSDANLNTLDHYSLILTFLPLYLFLLARANELYPEWRWPPTPNPPALEAVGKALFKWFLLYQAIDILSVFAVVITTPGSLAKFIVALDLWFDLILTCTAKLSLCILVQGLADRMLYSLSVRGAPPNFTDYARLCKAVLRLYFWGMVAAVVPGSRADAFAGAHFREDELEESDREGELDSEEDFEEDDGEEAYNDNDWGNHWAPVDEAPVDVTPVIVEGFYGEQSYEDDEISLEEWGNDAGMHQLR
ncbi:hypothetical protein JMJ35_003287 [Cladonia borealis]|uniref:Uncharacterized protein n=1 Tax=Cladonia borealis TaxID=184061 RepID=A0AA39R6F5_9LECA|nr:hypothetical protein JMJ35_003287 [Cladonia borealis]